MNKILLFILLLCTHWASAQVITFQNDYGADTAHEDGQTVIQVADSGFFVCGQRLLDTGYIGQGLLMRTDKFGNELWRKHYNYPGSSNIRFDNMILCSDGNLVVTGQIYFDVSDFNAYIAKLDTAGNIIWEKSYGGAGRQSGRNVKETLDGGFVVCGFNDSFPSTVPEFYLLRTNGQGDSLWSKTYPNEMEQYAQAVGSTSDSGFVLVGSAKIQSELASRPYVVRTDKYGDTLWTRIVTELDKGQAVDVHVKADNSIVITGSSSILSWGAKPMLAEIDDLGNVDWFEVYFNNTVGNGYGLCATNDNGFVISGLDTTGNFYIIKTDSAGQQQWFRFIDESSSDWGAGIQQTSDGGYVFTGSATYYDPNFNPDLILIKLDANGLLSSEFTNANQTGIITIYPNPGKDVVYIRNNSGGKLLTVELNDLTGKLVRAYDTAKTTIDVSGLSKGVYILKLVTKDGTLNNKLVIE